MNKRIVIHLPVRIKEPISYRTHVGWFGVMIYEALYTDGKYRRVSRRTIERHTVSE